MKTFIISLALLIVTVGAVIFNMLYISAAADEMLQMAESLPKSNETFEQNYDSALADTERLWQKWDEKIEKIAVTVGYDNINRTDDAMAELYSAAKNRDGDSFVTAAMKFSDSLRRLKKLENFDLQSIL